MWTVPSQEEVHVLARILKFGGEIDGYGEGRVAVACSVTDVPMRSNRCLSVANKCHGVHQSHILADGIANGGIVFLGSEICEIHTAASTVAELLILSAGIVDALYLAVEGWNTLQSFRNIVTLQAV